MWPQAAHRVMCTLPTSPANTPVPTASGSYLICLCSPSQPHPCPAQTLGALTWAAVLQDDGQEKVLGEHGARAYALLPLPSLLTTSPVQPAGLTAWGWAAERSASCPFSPGQSLQRRDPPPTADHQRGDHQDHLRKGCLWVENGARLRPQHCLLRSFSSPHSPPPVLNLYPAAHPFWCQSKVSLRNPRRVSAPWGYPRHLRFLQSLQLSVQTGCGFKAPGDPSRAQNLPPGCWGSRVGLVGLGSRCLGHPSTTTLTC